MEKTTIEAVGIEKSEILDIIPEFSVSSAKVATLASGDIVLHVLIPDYLQDRFGSCTKVAKKIGAALFTEMGLPNFCGTTREELISHHPELKGQTEVEPGVFVDNLPGHLWNYKGTPHNTCYFSIKPSKLKNNKTTLVGTKKIKVADIAAVGSSKTLKWLDKAVKTKEAEEAKKIK